MYVCKVLRNIFPAIDRAVWSGKAIDSEASTNNETKEHHVYHGLLQTDLCGLQGKQTNGQDVHKY